MALLPKPDECRQCPLWGDGKGYVPDQIVEGSEVAFFYQGPGEDEEKGRKCVGKVGRNRIYQEVPHQPLIGATGSEFDAAYLPNSGLERPEVSIVNLIKCRDIVNGKRTNEFPKGDRGKQAVEHCTQHHLRLPASTRLVVAGGAHAWDYATGGQVGNVSDWRGYLAPLDFTTEFETTNESRIKPEVFATLHVADLFREPRMRTATKADYRKIARFMRGEWPKPTPDRWIVTSSEQVSTAVELLNLAVKQSRQVAIDTEFDYKEGDPEWVPGSGRCWMIGLGWYDPNGQITGVQIDLSSTWFTEEELNALVGAIREVCYNCPTLFQNAAADLPVMEHNWGIVRELYHRVDDLLLAHAALWCELPHTLEFIASITSPFMKMKHLKDLNPLLYNWGDVIDLLCGWEYISKELRRDPGSTWIYENEFLPLINIHTRSTEEGIAIDKASVAPALRSYMDKIAEALKMARAYVGFPLNLGSSEQVGRVLYDHLDLQERKHKKTKRRTINDDAIAELRKEIKTPFNPEEEERNGLTIEDAVAHCTEGGNPVLEARVIYAKAGQVVNNYLGPLVKQVSEKEEVDG